LSESRFTGFSQKGPFLRGSSVTLQELDGKTLAQTGRSFRGNIESDNGSFAISSLSLVSQYAFLEASGLGKKCFGGGKDKLSQEAFIFVYYKYASFEKNNGC
jgi:hypothetical protein